MCKPGGQGQFRLIHNSLGFVGIWLVFRARTLDEVTHRTSADRGFSTLGGLLEEAAKETAGEEYILR